MSDDILNQAKDLVRAGKKEEARHLLLRLIRQEPQNELSWMWLVETMPDSESRVKVLEQCLNLIPDSKLAQEALERLRMQGLPAVTPYKAPPPQPVEPAPIPPVQMAQPEPVPFSQAFTEPIEETPPATRPVVQPKPRPQPASQTKPATPPRKKTSPLMIILIVILLVILCAAVLWFGSQYLLGSVFQNVINSIGGSLLIG